MEITESDNFSAGLSASGDSAACTTHEWFLKRNCCLTPRQLGLAYAVLFLLSSAVAAIFTLHGAWQVFVYSMLEMAAVAYAFLHYARHATDHERIELSDDCLLIERVLAGQMHRTILDPHWTRVAMPRSSEEMVKLEACGTKVQIGRFVTEATRRKVAQELRHELRGSWCM